MEDIEITDQNFHEYFFDAKKHRPKQGQVLAKFTAIAEFIDGRGKTDIIGLLKTNKSNQAAQVMKKIHGAKEPDCYRVCREMAEDLLHMPEDAVEQKAYEYIVEYFFYTQKEYVPKTKHWQTIQLASYDAKNGEFKSDINL